MENQKDAPKGLGALLNKKDTIIAIILTLIIAFLWFETTKFEKVPDLFANNIPPEMFPQILLIIILGMVLIIPFEHIFLTRSGKNIDSSRKKSSTNGNYWHYGYFIYNHSFFTNFRRSSYNNSS